MGTLWTEIRRKLTHLLWGVLLAEAYWLNLITWRFFLGVALLFTLIIFSYRATREEHQPLFHWFFDQFEREEDRHKRWAGMSALHYHYSFLLVVLLFPKAAAVAGMLTLALGDALALWCGVFFGKVPCPWNKKKDLDARILTALLVAAFLLPVLPYWKGFLSALIGLLAESLDYKKVRFLDDNLVVPIVTALVVILLE